MSDIYVTATGNGTAYVDNPTPNDGDVITLYAYSFPPDTLYDVVATDSQGYSIALSVVPVQQFVYQGSWGNMFIDVTFTGVTPPPPLPWIKNNLWILFKRDKWRLKQ